MERLTKNRRKILLVLLEVAPDGLHGADIAEITKIPSGSLYPALREFRKGPLVRTEWKSEGDDERPLRFYALTPDGVALARQIDAGEITGPADWRRFVSPTVMGRGWRW